jgi:hypothetical protein
MDQRPGQSPDPERRERILGKLAQVWGSLPEWRFAWLVDNLVAPGARASGAPDDELELALDRLLHADLK